MQDSLPTVVQGEATAWQNLRPSEVAAIRHWFVESEGSYVGPVEIGEIERLWQSGDIDEQTRVWTEGMADWQPLGDVPDLMYLVLEMPQPSAAESEPPMWVPAAAASLATLVQTEMQALSSTPEPQESPEAFVPSDLPEFAAVSEREPFPGWWAEGRALPSRTPWPSDPWRYRAPVRRSPLALSRRQLWGLGLGVTLAGALATTVVLEAVDGARPATSPPADGPSLVASSKPGAERASAARVSNESTVRASDTAEPVRSPAGAASVAAKAEASSSPAPSGGAPSSAVPAAAEHAALRSAVGGGARASRNDRRESRDDEQIEEGPATRRRSTVASPLTPSEVIAAVRPQVRNLAPCIKQARSDGMLEAKQYKFILDWRIRPDGSVKAPALKGPPAVLGSSMVRCFEANMHEWSFRPSAEEFAVRNFPLPVTVR